jgi:hypothetical protein
VLRVTLTLFGFIPGMEQPDCGDAVIGAEAFLFASNFIVQVEASTFLPFIESESLFHNWIASDEVMTIDRDSGKEQVGVKQRRPELNFAGTSAGTQGWKSSKSRGSNRLDLEAGVGIGHLSPRLQFKYS